MTMEVDRRELIGLKESLWAANEQAHEIQDLAQKLIQRNNELIWQVYCLAESIQTGRACVGADGLAAWLLHSLGRDCKEQEMEEN